MCRNISWLFFDMGSTLIDERFAYAYRLKEIARLSGTTYAHVHRLALQFYKQNKKGDLETARWMGVPLPAWPTEKEFPYHDAVHCLKRLHQRYHIGVIANQLPGARERLAQYGMLPYMDVVVASAEEGVAKPDPKIFALALKRSGCSPDHAVMIGDRIDNDILPAKKMGMHTIWIQQGFGRYWTFTCEEEKPEHIVQNLSALCSIL